MANYVIQQGDCLSAIAKRNGFSSYRAIYDHPQNEAFRRLRPNPNVVLPGDKVFVPQKETRSYSCSTAKQHDFVLKRTAVRLRIVIEDDQETPLGNRAYLLEVGGKKYAGRTHPDGLIDAEISATATTGKLHVASSETGAAKEGCVFPLAIGELDPVQEMAGVQGRLNNLGYHCGAVDGILGPNTRRALRDFQRRHHLDESGDGDEPTRQKLKALHDG